MRAMKIWFTAFRLRTLPLALASIGLGNLLAASEEALNWKVASLCLGAAILLQILSNIANDYGDSVHGADNEARVGPTRATQSGRISKSAMKKAVWVLIGFCLVFGYWLIHDESIVFHISGLAAIAAAVAYTAGPKPYGYVGLGDIFVFCFFGLIGVCGSYFLQTHHLNWQILLPAISCGVFCVAVLNINNIRDIKSDAKAGKITIPVRLGKKNAVIYHNALLVTGLTTAFFYVILNYSSPVEFLFIVCLPLMITNAVAIAGKDAAQLDPYLKQMALATLLFSFSFGLGYLL